MQQFRQVFKWPHFEVCSFMNITNFMKLGDDIKSKIKLPLVGIFNDSFVRDTAQVFYDQEDPQKRHPCPLLKDDIKRYNYSSSKKFSFEMLQPDGDYRYEHKVWSDEDANIFTATIYEKFKTGEESFF